MSEVDELKLENKKLIKLVRKKENTNNRLKKSKKKLVKTLQKFRTLYNSPDITNEEILVAIGNWIGNCDLTRIRKEVDD